MNNICIKPYITEVWDGFTLQSLDSFVSVTIFMLHLLSLLSLSSLLIESIVRDSSNKGGPLHIFILVSSLLLSWFVPFKHPPTSYTPGKRKANKQVTLNDKTQYTLTLTQSTLQIHKFHVKHKIPKGRDFSVLSYSSSLSLLHNRYWLCCLCHFPLLMWEGLYMHPNISHRWYFP